MIRLLFSALLAISIMPSQADDALWKGEWPDVPKALQNGTASRADVDAWSALELSNDAPDRLAMTVLEKDFTLDGTTDLFIAQPSNAGTGGNLYLGFEKTTKGYRYAGSLSFGLVRVLPKGKTKHPQLVTYWHTSCCEGVVTLVTFDGQKFHNLSDTVVHTGDWDRQEDNLRFKELFEGETVSAETLRDLFEEPVYKGKKLSVWLDILERRNPWEVNSNWNGKEYRAATNAIAQLGTRSVRSLRRSLMHDKQELGAAAACSLLGPLAKDAEPELIRSIYHTNTLAPFALVEIGTNNIPALTNALDHPDPNIRHAVVHALLGGIAEGKEMASAFPALKKSLHDPDARVRERAAAAFETLDHQRKLRK